MIYEVFIINIIGFFNVLYKVGLIINKYGFLVRFVINSLFYFVIIRIIYEDHLLFYLLIIDILFRYHNHRLLDNQSIYQIYVIALCI